MKKPYVPSLKLHTLEGGEIDSKALETVYNTIFRIASHRLLLKKAGAIEQKKDNILITAPNYK